MTVYSIEMSSSQLRRIRSADTIVELCIRICVQITGYFRMTLTDSNNQAGADKLESALTMLQWYFGILSRAGVADNNYLGPPHVMAIYVEKLKAERTLSVKQVFNFQSIRKVPNQILVEFLHTTCVETLKVIIPCIVTLNTKQIQKWEGKILDILSDINQIMGFEPITLSTKLTEILLKFSVADNQDTVHDFVS